MPLSYSKQHTKALGIFNSWSPFRFNERDSFDVVVKKAWTRVTAALRCRRRVVVASRQRTACRRATAAALLPPSSASCSRRLKSEDARDDGANRSF